MPHHSHAHLAVLLIGGLRRVEQQKKGRTQTNAAVAFVDIAVNEGSRGLFVTVDGQQCGPYTRLRFGRTPHAMRIAHFLPIVG